MSDPGYDPLFGGREPSPAPAPAARRRSAETWARVREGYLAGVAAPELCARFDVGLSALRLRAREEGWRRTDALDPEPDATWEPPEPEVDAEAESASPVELRALAWARMSAAVRRGRVVEANGWMRLVRQLDACARADAAAPAQQARAADALSRACEGVAALRARAAPAAEPQPEPAPAADLVPAEPARLAQAPDIPASIPLPGPRRDDIAAADLHDLHDLHATSPPARSPPPGRGPALAERPPPWVRAALGLR